MREKSITEKKSIEYILINWLKELEDLMVSQAPNYVLDDYWIVVQMKNKLLYNVKLNDVTLEELLEIDKIKDKYIKENENANNKS
tara:strand:+ start:254 stop:508 length:255 start_codon:yes stop_codon:yes gene_type:complete